jgi:inhibitor of KinA sporulation pathway (predicted exonuclease)
LVNNKYISIDLELEQPYTNPQTPDSQTEESVIIQVGAVAFEVGPQMSILEQYCINLHYDQPLSEFIKKLTGITDEQVNKSVYTERSAFQVLRDLRDRHDCNRLMIQWGHGDYESLLKNTPEYRSKFGHSAINTKHLHRLYCASNNKNGSGGLAKAMSRHGLQFQCLNLDGKTVGKHNALVDAYNTAIIFNYLYNKMKQS